MQVLKNECITQGAQGGLECRQLGLTLFLAGVGTRSGYAFVTTPAFNRFRSYNDDLVHHVRRYTRRELRAKLVDAGLSPRRLTSFVSVLLPAMAGGSR